MYFQVYSPHRIESRGIESCLANGGRTSPPHRANNAFPYGCALGYTTTQVRPLPSY